VRTGWRLGVILILFAAAATVLHAARPVTGTANPVSLFALPRTVGVWSGADGVPEDILPSDPNEKVSVRRTYRHGTRVAWVSVALFVGQEDETRRASVNKVYPQRNVSLIEPAPATVFLAVPSASPIALPAVIVHQDTRQLLIAYWHQIGKRVYGNEYRYRLALMGDLIFRRRSDAVLVRVATPAGREPRATDDLAPIETLASSVYASLGDLEVGK
jgi:EpsI family protein